MRKFDKREYRKKCRDEYKNKMRKEKEFFRECEMGELMDIIAEEKTDD